MRLAPPTSTNGEADLYIYSENAAMAYSQKYLPPKCEFTMHMMTMDGSVEYLVAQVDTQNFTLKQMQIKNVT